MAQNSKRWTLCDVWCGSRLAVSCGKLLCSWSEPRVLREDSRGNKQWLGKTSRVMSCFDALYIKCVTFSVFSPSKMVQFDFYKKSTSRRNTTGVVWCALVRTPKITTISVHACPSSDLQEHNRLNNVGFLHALQGLWENMSGPQWLTLITLRHLCLHLASKSKSCLPSTPTHQRKAWVWVNKTGNKPQQ